MFPSLIRTGSDCCRSCPESRLSGLSQDYEPLRRRVGGKLYNPETEEQTVYLASLEVDQRQAFIHQTDTLREMLGASRLISHSTEVTEELLAKHPAVDFLWPVSGVVRFGAEDLSELAEFLWELRACLEEDGLTVSAGIVKAASDYDQDLAILEQRVRHRKDAKNGLSVIAALPYFAPCQVQGQYPANHWSALYNEASRRDLRSWQSRRREELHYETRPTQYWGLDLNDQKLPKDFDDLVATESDSYIAVIKADVDGLGRLLAKLRLKDLVPEFGINAREAGRKLCAALEKAMRSAVQSAFDALSPATANQYYPFIPFIAAGDDLAIASQRHLALDLVSRIGLRYAVNAAQDPLLKQALSVSGNAGDKLTLSFGVLFIKKGYPIGAGFDLSEQLLRRAKDKRKELQHKEGCVDFHWLASSGRDSIDQERDAALLTRPWVISELEQSLVAAKALADTVPRRKLKQLDTILRFGGELADLAFDRWWLGLREQEERVSFRRALNGLLWPITDGKPAIWNAARDPSNNLLELALLTEIQSGGKA